MKNLKTFEEKSLTVKVGSDTKMKINVDDTILSGKFKNKKIKVKSINTNSKGDVTINGKPFNKMRTITENMDVDKKVKMEKLKELLELISEVDIMFSEEQKEYFFEWWINGKFVHIFLSDYI